MGTQEYGTGAGGSRVKRLTWAFALFAVLLARGAYGADDDNEPIDSGRLIEQSRGALEQATGFIVDRSVTNFGHEFLCAFEQSWRTQVEAEGIDLTVVEKPSARWGSTIWVEYKNRPIARVFLQSGSASTIGPLASNLAHYIAGRIADNTLLGLLTQDPDLGAEELP